MNDARYFIQGQVYAANAPDLQGALASIHGSAERPRCLCVAGGVDMYVSKVRQYIVKRMPGTGPKHHPECDAYEADYDQSGLGALMGKAVVEKMPGQVELSVDFAFSMRKGRAVPPGECSKAADVKAPKQRMTLRALLHFLFEKAGFNRWYPAMSGKRNQHVIHKYLTEAAEEIHTKGLCLAERLLVPESYSDARRAELFESRRRKLSILYATDESHDKKLMLIVGEFKTAEEGPSGCKISLRHLPDVPLYIAAKTWAKIEKQYQGLFRASETELPARPRLIIGALVYARQEHTFQIDTACCMLTTSNWVPIEGAHEIELLDALTRQARKFVKPLRYDAPSAAQFANALLIDTGAEPTSLHVVSAFTSDKERAAKAKLLGDSPDAWVWNTADAMPALPPFQRLAR